MALSDLSKPVRETILDDVLFRYFLLPEPTTGCRLAPDMLLRHASGQLYQEAHLRLEREFRQGFLPGLASDAPTGGLLTKDVRLTPSALARALVEQAIAAIGRGTTAEQPEELDILDPACGSGVFLQEALRALVARGYSGTLTLRGFDASPVSCEISKFCLERVKRDLPTARVSIDIRKVDDSLQEDWGAPDLILMNPPFVPWERMPPAGQEVVNHELGDLAKFRADLAMAFIWKGVKALSPNASWPPSCPLRFSRRIRAKNGVRRSSREQNFYSWDALRATGFSVARRSNRACLCSGGGSLLRREGQPLCGSWLRKAVPRTRCFAR